MLLQSALKLLAIIAMARGVCFAMRSIDEIRPREVDELAENIQNENLSFFRDLNNRIGAKVTRKSVLRTPLPEPITRSTFNLIETEKIACLPHLGCINPHPVGKMNIGPFEMNIKFKFFRGESHTTVHLEKKDSCYRNQCRTYPFDLSRIQSLDFDPTKKTVFLIGGYLSNMEETWRRKARKLWAKLEDPNIVLFSWAGGTKSRYMNSISNSRIAGRAISAFIYYLGHVKGLGEKEKFNDWLSRIHLAAYSLGSHVAGTAGLDLDGRIGRITGLDPAGPRFHDLPRHFKLDKSNAIVVDVFHTNGGNGLHYPLGHGAPLGHLDYYINGGSEQPGCRNLNLFQKESGVQELVICHHERATRIYNEMLRVELDRSEVKNLASKRRLRPWAYRAHDVEDFRELDTMSELCPSVVFGYSDEVGSHPSNCMVPLDFTSNALDYKRELQTKYDVNFDKSADPTERYYISTLSNNPFLTNHNLLQIGLGRNAISDDRVYFKVELGENDKLKVDGPLRLQPKSELYQVASPILSRIPVSDEIMRRMIHELETERPNEDLNRGRLLTYAQHIFPRKMTLKRIDSEGLPFSCFPPVRSSARHSGNFASRDELEYVRMLPMVDFDRLIVATYSKASQDKVPRVHLLQDGEQVPLDARLDLCRTGSIDLSIDTIYIGKRLKDGPVPTQPEYPNSPPALLDRRGLKKLMNRRV